MWIKPVVLEKTKQEGFKRKYLVIIDGAVYEIGYDRESGNLSPFEGHIYKGIIFENMTSNQFTDYDITPWANLPFAIKTEIVKIEDTYNLGIYSDNYRETLLGTSE